MSVSTAAARAVVVTLPPRRCRAGASRTGAKALIWCMSIVGFSQAMRFAWVAVCVLLHAAFAERAGT